MRRCMTTNDLLTIDLAAVTGGQDHFHAKGELDGDLSGIAGLASLKVRGMGEVDIDHSDYGACLGLMKGRPTDDIIKACGKPGAPVTK